MLYFSRWKVFAIVAVALAICLFAVPNFFPEKTVKSWPKWAQRHIVLGLDLQGGSHILLEVDSAAVRKEKLDQIRDDVRRTLRDARIGYSGLTAKGDAIEVRIREQADFANAYAKLKELSQPLGGLLGSSGARSMDVTEAPGNAVRLAPTLPAITERIRQSVDQSIQIVERRVNELGTVEPLIQRQGLDRILVQVPACKTRHGSKSCSAKPRNLISAWSISRSARIRRRRAACRRNPNCSTARRRRSSLTSSRSACWSPARS